MRLKRDLVALRQRLQERRAAGQVKQAGGWSVAGLEPGTFQIAVYFADPPAHLYQLRQWFESLRSLDQEHRVVVVVRRAKTALALQTECPVPVVYAPNHHDIDPLMSTQPLRVVFYVNHNLRNFAMLWHPDVAHVYIGHGESDKIGISASNQLKAYDYCFVSGQAAVDRIRNRLINYDVTTRVIEVGRPQVAALDAAAAGSSAAPTVHRTVRRTDRTVVLYAPSWEGDRPANNYGSLGSHGVAVVAALLADQRYQLVFRPHPLTGSKDPKFSAAQQTVESMIQRANQQNPSAGHVYDRSSDFGWQLGVADVCVADISAVAYDWLATRKPLVVTQPVGVHVNADPRGIAGRLTLLSQANAAHVTDALADAQSAESLALIDSLATYYFGALDGPSAMQRWREAISQVIAQRDHAVARRDGITSD
ncbi:MAG: CDP-glycerol glycerophosphotransferase family protein [Candidatus Nanopelagicales bacterium]